MNSLQKTMSTICKNVQCTSYSEEDGCTVDNYSFTFMVEEGRVIIRHEISCGLMGNQLFCGPPIDTCYGISIPEHLLQMATMVLETNELRIEPRRKVEAVESFISWFDDSMKQIAKEKRQVSIQTDRLKKETALLEREMAEMYEREKIFMNSNIGLLGLLKK
jgi:hypothetical protein